MGLYYYFQQIVGQAPIGFEWLPYIFACIFFWFAFELIVEFIFSFFYVLFGKGGGKLE